MFEPFCITLWAYDTDSDNEGYSCCFSGEKEKENSAIEIMQIMQSSYNSEKDRYEFPSKGDMFLAVEKLINLLYL